MGIFSKSNKQSSATLDSTTVISEGTFIKGGIDTSGSVFIDGKFEGAILAANSLTIGKTGEVIGKIKVGTLTVSGLLDGIINAEDVSILESGRILGTMQYQNLIIEKNGVFEGKGTMKNSILTSQYKSIEEPQFQELIEDVLEKDSDNKKKSPDTKK
jgi:cytoskeletal protein CcmA (bactofilin family)